MTSGGLSFSVDGIPHETNETVLRFQQLESLTEVARECEALSFALNDTKNRLRDVEAKLFLRP